MTVALYARRKEWPLEEVTVRLQHSRIHAADCAECETEVGRLDRIEWSLQFRGDLTTVQRDPIAGDRADVSCSSHASIGGVHPCARRD